MATLRDILDELVSNTGGDDYFGLAIPEAEKAIGDLIVDAQASEAELVREGERRAYMALIAPTPLVVVSDDHDLDAGGNCRAPGCRWFSDGDRRHNEPGASPGEPRGSVWD